jgi:methylmalonyl-CoA mutase C-terminal domain/subunit
MELRVCLDKATKPLLQSPLTPYRLSLWHMMVESGRDIMTTERKIRVLIAKPGLDGHDRGAKVLALALRDAGMEVIYTGLRQQPEQIVAAAIQEDVDVVGMSCLSGAHNHLFPRVVELLKSQGADDVLVVGGGTIPDSDIPELQAKGVEAVFGPGSSIAEIVTYIREHAPRRS